MINKYYENCLYLWPTIDAKEKSLEQPKLYCSFDLHILYMAKSAFAKEHRIKILDFFVSYVASLDKHFSEST